jgi:hypothetical protein
MNATYSKIIGAVVALVGILGFFQNPVLGIFGVNLYSNIIHLLGGAIVFWKAGKQTNMILGWFALVVGVIGFVPYLSAITDFLGFNTAFHILHIVIGVVSLAVAYMAK